MTRLTDEQVQTIYAAFEKASGFEASTLDGRRALVEPIVEAVLAASGDTPRDGLRCPTCGSRAPTHRGWNTNVEPWVRCDDGWHASESPKEPTRGE